MPDELSFTQVDAFARRPFEGNPAAVFPLERWLDDGLMQAIALEMNLSETAFYMPCEDDDADFKLRWFTPAVEVELCGHATLASGFHALRADPALNRVRFKTRWSGVLAVARDGELLTLDLPAWHSVERDLPALAKALGLPPASIRVTTNAAEDSFMAVYEREEDVLALAPDFRALAAIGNVLVIATAPGAEERDYDVVSRVFAPGAGIDEDPVTGSAHAMLTPYWCKRLGRDEFTARQASKRGGRIDCRRVGDRVVLGGSCVAVVEGSLRL
jgi:PhzF family phenazine biosynthesis protein